MAEGGASPVKSVAEASLLMKSINDLTQCAICHEMLSQPKLLPCFHTFCLGCLQKSFADQQPGDGVPCAVCRRIFNVPDDGIEALPPHFFVENILDSKRILNQLTQQHKCEICCDDDDDDDGFEKQFATSYCGECAQFLCSRCSKYGISLSVYTLWWVIWR